MKELAAVGWTRDALAGELGITPGTLTIYLRREGVTLKRKAAGRKPKFSDEQAIALKRNCEAWEGTKVEFAQAIGVSMTALRNALQRAEALLSQSEAQSQALH